VRPDAPLERLTATACRVPTDRPEADGTFAWDSTTIVLVEAAGGGMTGIGYTYADAAVAGLVTGALQETLRGRKVMDISAAWHAMQRRVRNIGREGLAACAISAVDAALWDLKARLLGLPLVTLLGAARAAVPIYGSGGFTTYDDAMLQGQLSGWVEREGCRWVKMKIGSDPARDPARLLAARQAIGEAGLFMDANGAFSARQALAMAELAAPLGVLWFEEPVSSDNLAGLALLRRAAPPGMDIAAGEYGWHPDYVERMLAAQAVDVQQADATRIGGITGFLRAAAICAAHHTDLSGHCAPALHLHAACAAPRLRHLEWFHDHVRIEAMLFEGAPVPRDGAIAPDLTRPGLGLELKRSEVARHALH
jgi:L-alanine-DL-glutamate epimerase-like enolase superfamily enzyme